MKNRGFVFWLLEVLRYICGAFLLLCFLGSLTTKTPAFIALALGVLVCLPLPLFYKIFKNISFSKYINTTKTVEVSATTPNAGQEQKKNRKIRTSIQAISIGLAFVLLCVGGALSNTRYPSNENGKPSDTEIVKTDTTAEISTTEVDTTVEEITTEAITTEAETTVADETTIAETTAYSEQYTPATETSAQFKLSSIPEFSGNAYCAVNGNVPYFTSAEITNVSYEYYSDLDSLGRCGVCVSSIGKDLMPTEERGGIGQIKPSGWQTIRYDGLVDGNYLYNRCHLIGHQLTGENANIRNLITGTRYLNIDGMLPFENMVADYVSETSNHVMYRVTPIFEGENLVASGVLMEGWSVEDSGSGVCYCVYCYNVQPGITINYANGDSQANSTTQTNDTTAQTQNTQTTDSQDSNSAVQDYVANSNTFVFHRSGCSSVKKMSEKNKVYFNASTREQVIASGYSPCQICNP